MLTPSPLCGLCSVFGVFCVRAIAQYKDGAPSLKKLCQALLGRVIQRGEHCPVEDARATLELYLRHCQQWEAELGSCHMVHESV